MSNQLVRTSVFVVVALLSAGLAYVLRPKTAEFKLDAAVKQPLFPEFKDPQLAARLKIVQVKEDVGELEEFEIARDPDRGIWVIPSHENYPADAEDRVRDAATALIDLMPLDVVSTSAADQSTYGVVEPSPEVEAAQKGIGLLVTVEDAKGQKLAELIIGNKGKASGDDSVLYFVRKPKQDAIYVCKIEPEKFTTKFEDWIEKNLLKIDSFDISRVDVHDYTVPHEVLNSEQGLRIRPDVEHLKRRMDAVVEWLDNEGKWQLKKLVTYQGAQPVETPLGELEELNTQTLNDLKTALADLKIVNVHKKPEGLGADLKAGKDFLNKRESLISLQTVGFFPWPVGDHLELFAENGELVVATKDGVEYLLRFGRTAGIQSESDKMTRYLMVTARIDESQFADLPPEVRRELEGKASAAPAGPQPPAPFAAAQDTASKQDDGKQKSDAGKKQGNSTSGDEKKKTPDNPLRSKKKDPASLKERDAQADGDNQKAPGSAASEDEKQESKKSSEAKTEDKSESGDSQDDPAAQEAQRKLDELKDKFRKARVKVATLNFRFGDWYYIIAEDEFNKIHLTRQDLVKESEKAKEEGFDVDAFRDLEKQGLKPSATSSNNSSAPSGFPGLPGNGGQ